jgi:hypothetical protein
MAWSSGLEYAKAGCRRNEYNRLAPCAVRAYACVQRGELEGWSRVVEPSGRPDLSIESLD